MFLFAILLVTLAILLVFTIAVISIGGSIFIIVFGDVIVCMLLIAYLIKCIFFKKKNKKVK